MLWGCYPAKIDEKFRLKIPAKFRRDLPDTEDNTFFVTSDDGRCAQIYPIPVWERIAQKFQEPPRMDPANIKLLLVYTSNATSFGYINEVYNDVACPSGCGSFSLFATGTGVSVTLGATTSGIDFGLSQGGKITGTVTDAVTAAGVSGVLVYAYRPSGSSWTYAGSASTDSSGAYAISGLGTGTYRVYTAQAPGYLDELYNEVTCTGGFPAVERGHTGERDGRCDDQ